jgi:hypothetical protein
MATATRRRTKPTESIGQKLLRQLREPKYFIAIMRTPANWQPKHLNDLPPYGSIIGIKPPVSRLCARAYCRGFNRAEKTDQQCLWAITIAVDALDRESRKGERQERQRRKTAV